MLDEETILRLIENEEERRKMYKAYSLMCKHLDDKEFEKNFDMMSRQAINNKKILEKLKKKYYKK